MTSQGIEKYGRIWTPPKGSEITDLQIEMEAFRLGLTVEEGGLGKAVHYKNVVTAIWPNYDWHEWAQLTAQAFCRYSINEIEGKQFLRNTVGLAGGTDSGKSYSMATWGLVNYFVDPINTMVIIMSTSKMDAKQRIWAHVVKLYREASRRNLAVGRLIESIDIIKMDDEEGARINPEIGVSDASSIMLIAAGDEFKDDAQKRLQGRKNKRIFILCDEAQDCSKTVFDEAVWGFKGAEELFLAAGGNPSSIYDPMGTFNTPIKGWMSVDENSSAWKIKVAGIAGVCLRFDSEKSPNNDLFEKTGNIKYPYLPKPDEVKLAKESLGALNPQYWRKFRGMWPPSDVDDSFIFTELLIKKHRGTDPVYWVDDGAFTNVLGVDPAYSEGGDRFVVTHLRWGRMTNGLFGIGMVKQYILNRRAGSEDDFQYDMIEQVTAIAKDLGVDNEHIGVDASAGGIFWSIGERGALRGWQAVSFAGSASELQVSAEYFMRDEATDKPLVGKDLFHNASSELCFVGRYFLESDQIRGISPELAQEMVSRKKDRRQRKIIVETKKEVKKRIGKSPDLFDSWTIGLHVIRKVFGAIAGGEAIDQRRDREAEAFKELKENLTLTNIW